MGENVEIHGADEAKPSEDVVIDPGQFGSKPDEEKLPIGSKEQIQEAAGRDIKTEILEIPEWGYSVRVKAFTAAKQAAIRQIGFQQSEGGVVINWAMMEIAQFQMGVTEPAFSESEVRSLHAKSGPGFQRIIKWLDDNSGLDKKAMEEAKETFQGSSESDEV